MPSNCVSKQQKPDWTEDMQVDLGHSDGIFLEDHLPLIYTLSYLLMSMSLFEDLIYMYKI